MVTATPATPVPSAKPVDTRGLANQVIGETKICAVTQTELIYRGYEIADLAEKATFEGVAHLVLIGTKPTDAELAAFTDESLAHGREHSCSSRCRVRVQRTGRGVAQVEASLGADPDIDRSHSAHY